jgi:mono/diheme cytochrome c family protein
LTPVLGCAATPGPPPEIADDPRAYVEETAYRRGVLERDLFTTENRYAERRLQMYGVEGTGWDSLPERDPPSIPLSLAARDELVAGGTPAFDETSATRLSPSAWPSGDAEWISLGERVFYEYPLRVEDTYDALARTEGALEDAGFLLAGPATPVPPADASFVGLRVFREDGDDAPHVGPTCAQCHASLDPLGRPTAVRANRRMDVGLARLLAMGLSPGNLPSDIESSSVEDLLQLGPGRADVLPDGIFNPFAYPDFGGLRDMPYLHHSVNWYQRGTATLAVRCETLFITSGGERYRIPRVLSWALAAFLRSLPPPEPLVAEPDAALAARGEEVFDEADCSSCHVPPLFSSEALVRVDEVGTDPLAGESPERGSGFYRIPSLRGVGRNAPYLHQGRFPTLRDMFNPRRDPAVDGHPFGLELGEGDREALLQFLQSI